jgi:transcriptional regulator with XRE-family HTH domain
MDQKKTGQFLASLRRAKGKTQQQVADALYVSTKSVSRWESGDGFPDINILSSVASYYEVTVDELLKGERDNPEKTSIQADSTLINKNKDKDKLVANSLSKKELPIFIVAISLLGVMTIIGDILIPCGYYLVGIIMVLTGVLVSLGLLLVGDKIVKDSYKLDDSESTQKGIVIATKTIKERRVYYFDILFITVPVFLAIIISAEGWGVHYPLSQNSIGIFLLWMGSLLLMASLMVPYFLIRSYFFTSNKTVLISRLQLSLMLLVIFISLDGFLVASRIDDGKLFTYFTVFQLTSGMVPTTYRYVAMSLFFVGLALSIVAYIKKWKWINLVSLLLIFLFDGFSYVDAYFAPKANMYIDGFMPSSYGVITFIVYIVSLVWLLVLTKKKKETKEGTSK